MIMIVNLSLFSSNFLMNLFLLARYNRSVGQPDSSKTLTTELKSISSTATNPRSPSKKTTTQVHSNKSSPTPKGKKLKTVSNTVETTTKRSNTGKKTHQIKIPNQMMYTSTGLSSKLIDKISTPPISSNKPAKKSVTNAVMSYLHYRGANGGYMTGSTDKMGGNNIMHVFTSIACE
jgi:hypothetical protein